MTFATGVLDVLPAADGHGRIQAVVESPQGTRNKLKFDAERGTFRVSHVLPAGMSFPFDFGFIPGTRAPDGDPLDVLILMDAPAFPGCLVKVSLLGVVEAEQREHGKTVRNDRLIALAKGSTERGDPKRLRDLQPSLLDEIEAFFVEYNRLRDRTFTPLGRKGRRSARKVLEACLLRPH
jgi:inorganic pyrophosphatase